MREACHHNLYAIANSCGMNGVGADTTIKVKELGLVSLLKEHCPHLRGAVRLVF